MNAKADRFSLLLNRNRTQKFPFKKRKETKMSYLVYFLHSTAKLRDKVALNKARNSGRLRIAFKIFVFVWNVICRARPIDGQHTSAIVKSHKKMAHASKALRSIGLMSSICGSCIFFYHRQLVGLIYNGFLISHSKR